MSWFPSRAPRSNAPARKHLSHRLLVPICGVTAVALTTLVAVVATRTATLAERQATTGVEQMTERYASQVGRELGTALTTARLLGQTLEAAKAAGAPSRTVVDATVRELASHNAALLGVWTGWEPGAFDGRDAEFVGKPGHDSTGRYVPYFNRGTGTVVHEALVEYDKAGTGDYYLVPLKTGKETVVEPYVYPVAGTPTLITSLAVPVRVNGAVAGVAGVDVALAEIQKTVGAIRPFASGFAALVSGGGKLMAHPDSTLVGKGVEEAFQNPETLEAIRGGRQHVGVAYSAQLGDDAIRVVVPVQVVEGTPAWSLVLVAPRTAVLAEARALRTVTIGLGVLTIVLLAGVVAYLVRKVTRPLVALAATAERVRGEAIGGLAAASVAMAHGDLTAPADVDIALLPVGVEDEVGVLTRELNGIITQSRETAAAFAAAAAAVRGVTDETRGLTQAAQAGDLGRRGDASRFEGGYRELVEGINATLDAVVAPVRDASAVLGRLATRDLTARMAGSYAGEFGMLKDALNTAVGNLDVAFREVSVAAEQVAAAGEQITGGSQALAGGASEQAASLEEVAASLQELSAMARQTAENAGQAKQRSDAARASASEGATRMARLSEAISEIQATSVQTASILKTIDEIAFQTNLLALNAAVEAARAGDAGRGFAVVAEEVRALALRSAEASRRTATLVERSAVSAERGVALNADVLRSLTDINEQVDHAAMVIGEITAAGLQQADGVAQINQAVEQVNGVTQQVAANAEESASAAEELAAQAATLRDLVGGFAISAESDVPSVRRTPVRAAERPSAIEWTAARVDVRAPSRAGRRIPSRA
ncbi:MAG: methyl-accepting chemotaxis protein [Gemmatirosa sp.]